MNVGNYPDPHASGTANSELVLNLTVVPREAKEDLMNSLRHSYP